MNDAAAADGKAANALGKIEASYTVRIDVNGNVTGFGLSNDGAESEFAILANRFLVSDPGVPGGTPQGVFLIENGNVVLNSARIGTASIDSAQINDLAVKNFHIDFLNLRDANIQTAWINSAQIRDAQITNAKIGNAAISSAKIQDAAITNAKIGNAEVDTLKIAGKSVTSSDFGKWANAGGPWIPKEWINNQTYDPWQPQVFEVPITGVNEPGREVFISFDYDFYFNGGAAQFFNFWEKVYLVPVATNITSRAATVGLLRKRFAEVAAGENGGSTNISPTANNAKVKLPVARSGSTITTMPADADTVDYKVVFVWHLDTELVAHSSGNQYGILNPISNDPAKRFGLEDLEVTAVHYKR